MYTYMMIIFCSVTKSSVSLPGVPVMLWTSWRNWLHFSWLSYSVPEKSVCSWLAAGPIYPKPTRPVSHLQSPHTAWPE